MEEVLKLMKEKEEMDNRIIEEIKQELLELNFNVDSVRNCVLG